MSEQNYKGLLEKLLARPDISWGEILYHVAVLLKEYYKKDNPFYCEQHEFLKQNISEELACCQSGMVLGENWHGGCSSEYWQNQNVWAEKAQEVFRTIDVDIS